ncbi:uncharacterized protein IL334_003843 [Kwoniella shivajii]|uniref:Major facilitator superfamily (MFS) profile domain-containing protein n=1 Tax=Kwoniella shivajii TaxID=564305 RepID=A0ABZ1CYQ1_9TREE|nr:hypothetical protein IL334_003843 [Kwoniella shivajii]
MRSVVRADEQRPQETKKETNQEEIDGTLKTELDRSTPTPNNAPAFRTPSTMTRTHKIMLAATMSVTQFMMALSVGSSLLIIPVMADYFNVSILAVQWVASAYQLAYEGEIEVGNKAEKIELFSGLLVAGRLADLYGRKRLFLFGLIVGVIANIISGVIPNRIGLTIFRAIAGLGLSISAPAGFGIVGTNFREEPSRTMAFAALGLGTPVGAVVGEIIGGLIAGIGKKGWQYVYFLIAGFGIIPIISGVIYIPRDDEVSSYVNPPIENNIQGEEVPDQQESAVSIRNIKRVDWIGAGIITVGLSLLMFSITQAGLTEKKWRTPYIPPIFSLSIIMIILFGFWERHIEIRSEIGIPPIVRLSIFTRHKWRVTAILGIAFFDWMGICGWVYLTSVYYQDLLGYSPLKNALYILPAPVTGIICCYLVTLLAPRVSAPILLALGGIATGLANCLFAIQSPDTLYWKNEFFGAILQPFGGDLTIPIGSVMISNLCDDDEQSIAGALFQVSLQIAGTVDLCLSSLIQTQVESIHGLLQGLRVALWFNSACCWFVLVIIFLAFRKVGLAKDVAKGI